jgi:hypothetical protein
VSKDFPKTDAEVMPLIIDAGLSGNRQRLELLCISWARRLKQQGRTDEASAILENMKKNGYDFQGAALR